MEVTLENRDILARSTRVRHVVQRQIILRLGRLLNGCKLKLFIVHLNSETRDRSSGLQSDLVSAPTLLEFGQVSFMAAPLSNDSEIHSLRNLPSGFYVNFSIVADSSSIFGILAHITLSKRDAKNPSTFCAA